MHLELINGFVNIKISVDTGRQHRHAERSTRHRRSTHARQAPENIIYVAPVSATPPVPFGQRTTGEKYSTQTVPPYQYHQTTLPTNLVPSAIAKHPPAILKSTSLCKQLPLPITVADLKNCCKESMEFAKEQRKELHKRIKEQRNELKKQMKEQRRQLKEQKRQQAEEKRQNRAMERKKRLCSAPAVAPPSQQIQPHPTERRIYINDGAPSVEPSDRISVAFVA
ncbi:hypothetical protein HDV05_007086, partial [Chytridiales sp. JEL 0842]